MTKEQQVFIIELLVDRANDLSEMLASAEADEYEEMHHQWQDEYNQIQEVLTIKELL